MYTITDKRKIADWVKTKNKAKVREPQLCSFCKIAWCPIYVIPLNKGQYKSTCSLECTKLLQKKIGSVRFSKLWEDREYMIEKASLAGRKSASNSVRRSRDEIALFELCYSRFVNVKSNFIIVDGWDADIIIEEIKLAILWNGPWHYKQMPHKNHNLLQVQNRDRIKLDKLKIEGYSVLVFEDREYTVQSAFEKIVEFAAECDGSTKGS